MRGLAYRVCITVVNIFFPPLAVMMLCGAHWDCMLNCFLFLLAVIPSHVHGFYISCTYFHRRRKVKKGQYPGGPKSLIHSRSVINGGASDAEVERLYRQEKGLKRRSSNSRRASSRSPESNPSREYVDRRPDMAEKRYGSQMSAGRVGSGRTGTADAMAGAYAPGARDKERRRAEGVARDGYGVSGAGRSGGYEVLSPGAGDGSRTGRSGWRW